MKKRIISALLVLLMVLALLPMAALAESNTDIVYAVTGGRAAVIPSTTV